MGGDTTVAAGGGSGSSSSGRAEPRDGRGRGAPRQEHKQRQRQLRHSPGRSSAPRTPQNFPPAPHALDARSPQLLAAREERVQRWEPGPRWGSEDSEGGRPAWGRRSKKRRKGVLRQRGSWFPFSREPKVGRVRAVGGDGARRGGLPLLLLLLLLP